MSSPTSKDPRFAQIATECLREYLAKRPATLDSLLQASVDPFRRGENGRVAFETNIVNRFERRHDECIPFTEYTVTSELVPQIPPPNLEDIARRFQYLSEAMERAAFSIDAFNTFYGEPVDPETRRKVAELFQTIPEGPPQPYYVRHDPICDIYTICTREGRELLHFDGAQLAELDPRSAANYIDRSIERLAQRLSNED